MSRSIDIFISEEVHAALNDHRAVVALESTIISHGMPFPDNLAVAREVEAEVRKQGAVPATIAIVAGKICIGLEDDALDRFARANDVMKCSRRDLPYAVARGMHGATTVAATMILAEMAGIEVFATGGIGGVHRGAESSWDVSADLPEFAQTAVTVVSAGAKAILDLPKTLEYLETLGVPVVGYATSEFPAFYSRTSGLKLPISLENESEIAAFIHEKRRMNLKGGVLVANPIPTSAEIPQQEIEPAIQEAIAVADRTGIRGKELTPFLLRQLNEITKGRSQSANKSLVLNNAAVAARIAIELAAIRKKHAFIAL
jgi:pseudouridine-5'-phosphate glycosidase